MPNEAFPCTRLQPRNPDSTPEGCMPTTLPEVPSGIAQILIQIFLNRYWRVLRYIREMRQLLLCVYLLSLAAAFGQDNPAEKLKLQTQRHILVLNRQFEELRQATPEEKELQAACAKNCTQVSAQLDALSARKLAAMEEVAAKIDQQVDSYVVGAVSPKLTQNDCNRLASDLTQILGDIAVGPPNAFCVDRTKSRALVLVYAISGGTAINSNTVVRSYKASLRGLVADAITGNDLNGYGNLSVVKLHSPVPEELWLLIWGQAMGANGPNMRMRVYAYGTNGFKTMWMPANVWSSFDVTPTIDGFRIDGTYYRQDTQRHEIYQVTPYGLYMEPAPASSGRVK